MKYISQICNCRIFIDEFFRHTYPHFTVRASSLIGFMKIVGRTVDKMWFTQDANNFPASFETRWFENLPGEVHELVTTGS